MSALAVRHEELVKELKSLLDSSQSALDVETLKKDYRSLCCGDLSANVRILGYPSVDEFLRKLAAQGDVRIDYQYGHMTLLPSADEKTAHLRKLVQRQAPKKKKKNPKVRYKHHVTGAKVPVFLKEIVLKVVAEHDGGRGMLLSQLPSVVWKSSGVKLDVSVLGFKDLHSAMISLAEETPLFNVKPVSVQPEGVAKDFILTVLHSPAATVQARIPDQAPATMPTDSSAVAEKATLAKLSKHMKDSILRAIENSGPDGLDINNLPVQYKKVIGRELNVASLQFASLEELVSSVPDVATVRNMSSGQVCIRSTRLGGAVTGSLLRKSDSSLAESSDAGFQPVTKSAASVAYPVATSLTNRDSVAASSAASLSPTDGGRDGPAIVGIPRFCRLAQLPEISIHSIMSTTEHVRIVSIISPSLFHLQLASGVPQLESMEKQLGETYNVHGSAGLAISEASLEKGLLCAAQLGHDRWRRVAVVVRQDTDDIQVEAIDYGSSARVKLTSLRLLKPEFAHLPAQAISCCLTSVVPKTSSKDAVGLWPEEATNEFSRMCEKQCMADFIGVTRQGCQLVRIRVLRELNSAYGGGFDDADVAEALVTRGFAVRHEEASCTAPDGFCVPNDDTSTFSEEVLDDSVVDLKIRRTVLQSGERVCFVVTFEGHDYLTSSEICSYMKLESRALLTSRLRHSSGGFPHILLPIDQSIMLIQCLRRHGLECLDDGYSGITLYELQSVDGLLVAAGCDDQLLIKNFRQYISYMKAKGYGARKDAQLPACCHSNTNQTPTSVAEDITDALQRGLIFERTADSPQRDRIPFVTSSWAARDGLQIKNHSTLGARLSSMNWPMTTPGPFQDTYPRPATILGRGRGIVMNAVLTGFIGRGRGV